MLQLGIIGRGVIGRGRRVVQPTWWRNLKILLENVRPKEIDSDLPLWRWDRKGNFTVRVAHRHFVDVLRLPNSQYIWKSKCPKGSVLHVATQ